MASGITVTSNPDPAQLVILGVTRWPTWGCEVSTFPWTYGEQETCLLLEGDVTVTPDGGEPVQTPPRPTRRETTEAMVRNIGRELAEIEQAIGRCRGDLITEPKLTGSWMAHLLISSRELLKNLLIDMAKQPKRINGSG
jgi:hypothetical protein